jgi:hypothetical protein
LCTDLYVLLIIIGVGVELIVIIVGVLVLGIRCSLNLSVKSYKMIMINPSNSRYGT